MLFGLKNRSRVSEPKKKKKIEDDYSNEEFDFDKGFGTNEDDEGEKINEQVIEEPKQKYIQVENDTFKDKNFISNNLAYNKIDNSKLEKLKNLNFSKSENKAMNEYNIDEIYEENEDNTNQFLINRKRKNVEDTVIAKKDRGTIKHLNDKKSETGINDFFVYDVEKNNPKVQDNDEKINYDYIKPYHVNPIIQMNKEKKQGNCDSLKIEIAISNRDSTVYDYENADYLADSNVNIIDEDNFDTRKINKSTKDVSKDLNKYNQFFENSDELYLNDSIEEIKVGEPSESNEDLKDNSLQKEINKIKDIRNKKRHIQHKDENYDQDFVEIKNIKTDVLLKDVYKMIENHDYGHHDSVSESDKEILQWEMEKLKSGISSTNNRVSFGDRKLFKQEKAEQKEEKFNKNETNIKNYFKNINIINLDKYVNTIRIECDKEEKIIEHEFSKIDSINNKIKKTKELKEFNLKKIDFYVNQFKKMKSFYIEIIKLQKKKKDINLPKVLEYLDNEELYLSE